MRKEPRTSSSSAFTFGLHCGSAAATHTQSDDEEDETAAEADPVTPLSGHVTDRGARRSSTVAGGGGGSEHDHGSRRASRPQLWENLSLPVSSALLHDATATWLDGRLFVFSDTLAFHASHFGVVTKLSVHLGDVRGATPDPAASRLVVELARGGGAAAPSSLLFCALDNPVAAAAAVLTAKRAHEKSSSAAAAAAAASPAPASPADAVSPARASPLSLPPSPLPPSPLPPAASPPPPPPARAAQLPAARAPGAPPPHPTDAAASGRAVFQGFTPASFFDACFSNGSRLGDAFHARQGDFDLVVAPWGAAEAAPFLVSGPQPAPHHHQAASASVAPLPAAAPDVSAVVAASLFRKVTFSTPLAPALRVIPGVPPATRVTECQTLTAYERPAPDHTGSGGCSDTDASPPGWVLESVARQQDAPFASAFAVVARVMATSAASSSSSADSQCVVVTGSVRVVWLPGQRPPCFPIKGIVEATATRAASAGVALLIKACESHAATWAKGGNIQPACTAALAPAALASSRQLSRTSSLRRAADFVRSMSLLRAPSLASSSEVASSAPAEQPARQLSRAGSLQRAVEYAREVSLRRVRSMSPPCASRGRGGGCAGAPADAFSAGGSGCGALDEGDGEEAAPGSAEKRPSAARGRAAQQQQGAGAEAAAARLSSAARAALALLLAFVFALTHRHAAAVLGAA